MVMVDFITRTLLKYLNIDYYLNMESFFS